MSARSQPSPRSPRSLPILNLPLPEQRYSCHGCGGCCREFTVQLDSDDLARLREQGWAARLDFEPTVEFRGKTYLRQREDGACVFLMDNGLCRIHAEYGLTAKPIACQLFPFTLMPTAGGRLQTGLSFACPSVIHNRGVALAEHAADVRRMAAALPELATLADATAAHAPAKPPLRLTAKLDATSEETRAIVNAFDRWLTRVELTMETRLDGAAWLTSMLRQAKLENVRGARLGELLDTLVEALPEELALRPITPPTARQRKMLRQAAYAHLEDVKIGEVAGRGGIRRRAWRQFRLNRRFGRGRGEAPAPVPGWPPGVAFESIDAVGPATDEGDVRWMDFLLMRYVRARLLGGRTFGPGYYGLPVVDGLEALWLMLAAAGWLARWHAAGQGRARVAPPDVEAALLRTDRAAGRAPWLGSIGERLRLAYLAQDDGLRRLRFVMRLTEETYADAAASATPADNDR